MMAVSIRTATRAPGREYVGSTVRALLEQGTDPAAVHVCATHPETAWLDRELCDIPVSIHRPQRVLSPNENGLAMIRAVDSTRYRWLLLLEDDLAFCADFTASVRRWLHDHDRADRHVFRFFGFTRPPHRSVDAYDHRLDSLRGSQAIALRMDDALDFLAWGDAHLETWHKRVPWRSSLRLDPRVGFDKLVACWALTRWPKQPGLISHPYFVKHVGKASTIHARTVGNDALFAGPRWRYRPPVNAGAA